MENDKTPGNDGLSKEFYEVFWDDVKIPLLASINEAFIKEQLSNKINWKKRQRFIKNWRPISLLNTDLKLISRTLATRLNDILPDLYLISSNQTAYVKNRYISESGKLIYDVLETASILNKKGFLVTVDIEKAFDSVDHSFLLAVLQKYGFGERFLKWIQILIKNQESCVVNGGITTKFFSLYRRLRQGDPISAFLFILALEVSFVLIKSNNIIKGLDIYGHIFSYTAYVDDSSFFFKNKKFVLEAFKILDEFSFFLWAKAE